MKELHGYKSCDEFKVIQSHECATIEGLAGVLADIATADPRGDQVGYDVAVCIGNKRVFVHVLEFADNTRAIVLADN